MQASDWLTMWIHLFFAPAHQPIRTRRDPLLLVCLRWLPTTRRLECFVSLHYDVGVPSCLESGSGYLVLCKILALLFSFGQL
jgi:hypothetical protein